MPDDEEFRPGAHDLETPFIFVPHGAPDPVEFKRKYPGWVSFPATFVPHPRPIPKWKVINGQRWPLDMKGRPWPKTRYGRPTCPFDELPPSIRAPGTQVEMMRKYDHPTLFWEGEPMPTVAEVLAIGAKIRAERAAAAPPPPVQRPKAYYGDGLGPVRDYLDAMRRVDQHLREFAAAARQHDTARRVQITAMNRTEVPDQSTIVFMQTAAATSAAPGNTTAGFADTPDAEADLLTPIQFRRGGAGRTPMPGGGTQELTPGQHATMFRFNQLMETLRRLEPNNPEAHFLARPNTVPSETWIARLEAEVAQAQGRAQLGRPPRVVGNQLYDPNRAPDRLDPRAQERLNDALSDYQTQRYQVDTQVFQLSKRDMEHILRRHSPEFYIPPSSPTEVQTYFREGTTAGEVQEIVSEVLSQNRTELLLRPDLYQRTLRGKVNGTGYIVYIFQGRITSVVPFAHP